MDEPTLDALIDGSYNFPVAHKSKGKQASDGSSTIMRMVNHAFSLLRNADKIQSEKNNGQDSVMKTTDFHHLLILFFLISSQLKFLILH